MAHADNVFTRRCSLSLAALGAAVLWAERAGHARAADPPSPFASPAPDVTGLFDSDSVLHLTLTADFKALLRDRDSVNAREHPAKLGYVDAAGRATSLDVQLRTRGHWRRQARNCVFTPLRVTFRRKETEHTLFADEKRLKLVTHCQNGDEYDQYVLQEYLLYRVYGLLTSKSFRARLARVTYTDITGKTVALKHAFFIEDDDVMAKRNSAKVLEAKGGRFDDFDPDEAALVSAFQYMIGNTDWSIAALHNVVLLRDTLGAPVPVPYDFDFAGVIATRYARPDARLSIKSVRERLYRGVCRTPEEWATVVARFNEKKGAIYALYESVQALDPRHARDTRSYFEAFYRIINDRRALKREMVDYCQPGT